MEGPLASPVPSPEPQGLLAKAFDQYLQTIYGERAKILPQGQRNELEQAWMASAKQMLSVALSTHRRTQTLVQLSAEIDSYGAVRAAIVSINGKPLRARKS